MESGTVKTSLFSATSVNYENENPNGLHREGERFNLTDEKLIMI